MYLLSRRVHEELFKNSSVIVRKLGHLRREQKAKSNNTTLSIAYKFCNGTNFRILNRKEEHLKNMRLYKAVKWKNVRIIFVKIHN